MNNMPQILLYLLAKIKKLILHFKKQKKMKEIMTVYYMEAKSARVGGRTAPTPVLVAKQTIPKGTPGTLVATEGMYVPTTIPRKDVVAGAINDPQYLAGRAAATDVFPGSQLTVDDFSASSSTYVTSQITGRQRAISVAIDNIHGSLSQLQAGDLVDIYIATAGMVKLFSPEVKVLAIPTSGSGNLVLRIDTKEASKFAWANDNAQFWFVLRPAAGAKKTKPSKATAATVLH